LDVAREIIDALSSACSRICYAGSLRREKPDVGDIEILYIPKFEVQQQGLFFEPVNVNKADEMIRAYTNGGMLECRLNAKGSKVYGEKNKLMRHVASGIPVDLFAATADNWYNYLVCRTGPADSNKAICNAAIKKGWKWNPYGRGFSRGAEVRPMESEEAVFEFVGLRYREPRDRR